MKIIVGLGNPGKKYQGTRHNVGFMVLDKLIRHPEIDQVDADLEFKKSDKFEAEICEFRREGEKIILVKPQTFMNNSGNAVARIASFYNIRLQNLWVIADDIDLPLGRIRVRLKGSSAGHKGLQSIIDSLGNNEFPRIRMGICRPYSVTGDMEKSVDKIDAESYVLENFNPDEKKVINKVAEKAAMIIIEGIKSKSLTAHTY